VTGWTSVATLIAVTNPYPGLPQPQVPPPTPQPVYVVPQQPPRSGLAVASLTFGIIGLVTFCCTFGVPSLLAVILGHAALSETRRGEKIGHHNAKAGLILGYVVVVPAIVVSVLNAMGIRP
jgi:hypothetical protein